MKLYVKNMVSSRCTMIVLQELDNLNIRPINIQQGEVELGYKISEEKKVKLAEALSKWGLELIDDRQTILIERIKSVIIESIYNTDKLPEINFSTYLTQKLSYDYTYLSNTFSYVTGMTIEQFIIAHRIERAKNLLVDDNLSVSQIAHKLTFSSNAHLSNQFKKVTGLTPSYFKQIRARRKY